MMFFMILLPVMSVGCGFFNIETVCKLNVSTLSHCVSISNDSFTKLTESVESVNQLSN